MVFYRFAGPGSEHKTRRAECIREYYKEKDKMHVVYRDQLAGDRNEITVTGRIRRILQDF